MSPKAAALSVLFVVFLGATAASARSNESSVAAKRTEIAPGAFVAAVGRASQPAWSVPPPSTFVARNGGTWYHRVSGPTSDFRTLYGSGVFVGMETVTDAQAAIVAVLGFFSDNPELLPPGVRSSDLEIVSNLDIDGMRFVTLRQTVEGAPVIGTSVQAAIIAGRLVLVSVRAYPVSKPRVRLLPKATLSRVELEGLAMSAARDLGLRAVTAKSSSMAVLPMTGSGSLVLRPVFRVDLEAPYSTFTAFVDPSTGEIAGLRDNKQFFDATLMLRHHEKNPDPTVPLVETPAEDLLVRVGKQNAYTDVDGAFSFAGEVSAFTAALSGKYVDVRNAAGADYALSIASANPLANGTTYTFADNDEFDLAQIDAFAFTTRVRKFAMSLAFSDLPFFSRPMPVNVNVSVDLGNDNQPDFCNAYFDGQSLNFLPEGDMYGAYTCNNTAMIADILYHEYGHALHFNSSAAGEGTFDEAVSEGFSDTMATALTGEHVLGRFFLTTGQGIRDVKNSLVWPDDQSQDPHQTGLILAGAIWDLRETFRAKFGQEAGDSLTNSLFGSAMATSTDIESVFESFLLADDNNGDLADGTPNFCDIFDAFARHGLAAENLGRVSISHVPLFNLKSSSEPVVIEADVVEGVEDCSTLGEIRVVYSTDEGQTWTTVTAENQGGDLFRATLVPLTTAGSRLLYRIEADDVDSGLVTRRPSNPAEPYYTVYVGNLTQIVFDDFEKEDAGWTHELVSGWERETSDDWARGKPRGDGGDPATAYSGSYVWGNDLRPQITWDGRYDSGIHNALNSPAYDLSTYDNVRLQFRRWLTVEDGYFDKARVVVNGQQVWVNVATPGGDNDNHTLHHIDKEWVLVDLDISEYAAGQSQVRIRFELESDRGLQMGGWTIDDFALYTASEPMLDTEQTEDGTDTGDELETDTETGLGSGTDSDSGVGMDGDAINAMAGGCGCAATGARGLGMSLLAILLSAG